MAPRISFIIVNRNTADLLTRCIAHIYDSRLNESFEIIVVDNGSEDDSTATVKSKYPQVAIIEAGRNLGFAAANNLARAHAAGEVLILVNTDAFLEPECAGCLWEDLQSDPAIGIVGPQLLNPDGTRQTSFEVPPSLATEIFNRSLLKRLFPDKYLGKHTVYSGPTEVEALIGAVMAVRRAALDQVGGFDEDYFFFLEETDLAVRMRKGGWKVVHEPRAAAVHFQGGTAKRYYSAARIEFYRSRYKFFRKNYSRFHETILRALLTTNLFFVVLAAGSANLFTLGKIRSISGNFGLKRDLLKWHLFGCPDGSGLPR